MTVAGYSISGQYPPVLTYSCSGGRNADSSSIENMKIAIPVIAGLGVLFLIFTGCLISSPWTINGSDSLLAPVLFGVGEGGVLGTITAGVLYSVVFNCNKKEEEEIYEDEDEVTELELVV